MDNTKPYNQEEALILRPFTRNADAPDNRGNKTTEAYTGPPNGILIGPTAYLYLRINA